MEETKYNIFNVIEILQEKFVILTGNIMFIILILVFSVWESNGTQIANKHIIFFEMKILV